MMDFLNAGTRFPFLSLCQFICRRIKWPTAPVPYRRLSPYPSDYVIYGCELVVFTLGKRQDKKETGNRELRMAGNEASCQGGRSVGAPNVPGQQWPEEEAKLVGVYTPSLAVLGVMTSGRKWVLQLVSSLFTFYFLLVQCACMLYVHVCTQTCTDMHMEARCLPLLLSDLLLNLKLTMKAWLAGQKTPGFCLSLPTALELQVCTVRIKFVMWVLWN